MTKVLLLSAGFGDGHHQVANALRESFVLRGVDVYEVDCFDQTNHILAKLNQWMYEKITKYLPMVYGVSYRLTAKLSPDCILWKLLSVFSRRAFVRAVDEYEPDIVLQLFPDHASETVARRRDKPYLGVVITDFSVHSHWFHNRVDAYFIPNRQLSGSMHPFVPGHAEIRESGIPIRNQFLEFGATPDLTSRRPYVLFATGGRGVFPDLEHVLTTILKNLPDFDVYVLCGRNTDMLRRVEQRGRDDARLHGLSYIENVAQWFQNASVSVIKSGGITVSECLAALCPMVFYHPQPGQEADNAKFIAEMGAGVIVRNEKELAQTLSNQIFIEELQQMKEACVTLARPAAAEYIVNHVLKQMTHKGRGNR